VIPTFVTLIHCCVGSRISAVAVVSKLNITYS